MSIWDLGCIYRRHRHELFFGDTLFNWERAGQLLDTLPVVGLTGPFGARQSSSRFPLPNCPNTDIAGFGNLSPACAINCFSDEVCNHDEAV